jgi:hypothetical protein
MFCFGLNKKRLQWKGANDYRSAFADKYYRMTQVTGDALFCAPDDHVHRYYQDLAKSHGHDLSIEKIRTSNPRELLPYLVTPGNVAIFEEHKGRMQSLQSVGGTYIADIHQHPGAASTPGPDFPSQLRHGMVTSFRQGGEVPRLASGLEHLSAQGFHLFPDTTKDHAFTKMLPIFSRMRDSDLKDVSGNGMHLAPLSAWLVFCLANVAKITDDEQAQQP